MKQVNIAQTLDAAEIQMPVQWVFKDKCPNGSHVEVFLRRVKAGNEVVCADVDDTGIGTASHLKGKFSDAETLLKRFDDKTIDAEQADWMRNVASSLLDQMAATVRQLPELVRLFAPKGKIEIYGPNTHPFTPQYISGNFTLKIHVSSLFDCFPLRSTDLRDEASSRLSRASCAPDAELYTNLFAHLIAQHLDYPFGPGERRFSTARIFDLCFAAEKAIAPKSLAAMIDTKLEARGVYQPQRHELSDYEHVQELLAGESAMIRTSYERVLQRERFAALVAELYGKNNQLFKAPLLTHYRNLLKVTLLAHAKTEFKDYPPRAMDEMAQTIHIPIAAMFNINPQALAGNYDARISTG